MLEGKEMQGESTSVLRDSYRPLLDALNEVGQGYLIAEGERILYANEVCSEISGYGMEELLALQSSMELFVPEERDLLRERMSGEGAREYYESAVLHKSGRRVDVEVAVKPFRAEGSTRLVILLRSITERERDEEARSRLATIVESSDDAILGNTLEGIITSWNPGAEKLYGYSADEIIGQHVSILFPSERQNELSRVLERLPQEGEMDSYETVRIAKDGRRLHVSITASPIKDSSGKVIGTSAIVRDIAERREAEEALKESERRFRQLFERSTDALLVHDEEGRMVDCNEEACRSLGYTREELLRLSVRDFAVDLLSEEEKRKGDTPWRRAMNAEPGTLVGLHENEHRRKDGTTFPVEVHVDFIDYGGKRMMLASVRDITERKQAEEALRESEKRFRTIFEQTALGISIADPNRRLLETNQAYQKMLGYSEEDLYGKHLDEISHSDDVPRDAEFNKELLSGHLDRYQREKRYIRKDGELIWVQPTVSVVRDAEGEPQFLIGTVEDITERKRYKEALSESERRYRSVVDNIKEVVFQTDAQGLWTFLNPAWVEITGFSVEESIGTNFLNYIHPDDRQRNLELFRLLIEREKDYCRYEIRYMTRGGGFRWIEVWARLTLNDDGTVAGTSGTLNDITERKRAEEDLRESEARNRAILEATPDLMFLYSRDGEYLDIQANAPGKLYLPREILLGSNLRDLLPSEVADPFLRKIARTLDTGKGQTYEYRLTVPEGTLDFEARLVVSGPDEVLCAVRDVTERKRVENALKESEQRFRQLFEQSVEALIVHDEEGKIVDCNEEAYRSLGYTREELLSLRLRDIAGGLLSEEEKREGEARRHALAAHSGRRVGLARGGSLRGAQAQGRHDVPDRGARGRRRLRW